MAKTRHYLGYLFINTTGADQCMTVGYASSANVTIAMYLGSFDPAHVQQNLAGGHVTSSSCSATSGSFTVLVPNEASFEVVLSECIQGGGGSFQFQVNSACACASIRMDIRKGSGAWHAGGDLSATVARGDSVTFGVRVVNGGPLNETLLLRATGADATGYRITYFHGTHDITAAMTGGGYQATVAAGGKFKIKAVVKVLSGAGSGSSVHKSVEGIASAGPAQASDDVSFTVYRK